MTMTAAGCGGSSSRAAGGASGSPLDIGAVLALTGPEGVIGTGGLPGIQAAVATINAGGGINGHKVVLHTLDSGGDPTRARDAALQLIQRDHVKFMIPDFLAPDTVAIMPVTTAHKVITISPTGAANVVNAKQWPYEYQLSLPYSSYTEPISTVIKQLGKHKIGLITDNTSAGQQVDNVLNGNTVASYGLQFVGWKTFAPTAVDVTTQLQQLRNAGADVVVTAASGTELTTVMNSLNNLSWNVPVVGTTGASSTGNLNREIPAAVSANFSAATFRILARSGSTVEPRYQPWVTTLQKYGPIVNLLFPSSFSDVVKMGTYGFLQSKSLDPTKANAVLDNLNNSSLPANYTLVYGNPRWSKTDHSADGLDWKDMYAVIHVGPLVDGTYPGTVLPLTGKPG